jgi:hypothetical protein
MRAKTPAPPAAAPQAPQIGAITGLQKWWATAPRLRCWCGPAYGWRDLGDLVGAKAGGCIVQYQGRMSVSITVDLGPVVADEPETRTTSTSTRATRAPAKRMPLTKGMKPCRNTRAGRSSP